MKKETIRDFLNYKHVAKPVAGLIPALILMIVFNYSGWLLLSEIVWEAGLFAAGIYYTAAFLVMYEHDSSIMEGDNLPYLTEAMYSITLLSGAIVTVIYLH